MTYSCKNPACGKESNHCANSDLEIIRAACAKANPEIVKKEQTSCPDNMPGCLVYHVKSTYRPIHLADVLLAINSQFISVNSRSGDFMFDRINDAGEPFREWFYTNEKGERCVWNLRADDIEQQYPETLAFLANLLK